MTMETKITSKTSSLKALLLRAWRERWNDMQWGINIKTILPRGVSGDVYNLADCILQQAVVGSVANQRVLSYLKHSLSSQLVSYAAVLQRLSKFQQFQKLHCVFSILEFLETIQIGITCRGKPEEGVLATAILSIVLWLLQIYHSCLTSPPSTSVTLSSSDVLDKTSSILNNIINCDFKLAMVCLAKYNDSDLHSKTVKKCFEIDSYLKANNPKLNTSIEDSLKKLINLNINLTPDKGDNMENVTNCVQALIAIEVTSRPSSPTQMFVSQMQMVQRIKNFSNARLYSEIMRACLLSLNDSIGTAFESQWGAFTFLKIPYILQQLHNTNKTPDDQLDYSQDIANAIDLLLQHPPLLDVMDARWSCNSLECLLVELDKVSLLTDKHVKLYASKREGNSALKVEPNSGAIPKVITRAEPTLAGILKTLNTDYHKIHEPLLGMLYQVLTGKSFELILSVATVQGQLKTLATRLIRFNECSKQESRSQFFDVSFLMLCSIVQTYGSDVVLEGTGDSFFEQWVRNCMVETQYPKSPEQILRLCNRTEVDALIQQFNNSEAEFKVSARWHEILLNIPGVMHEVLVAWEKGTLTAADVKRILDAMRGQMCSLSIAAAAWLCSYMGVAPHDSLLKPVNMVQQLLTAPPEESSAQHDNLRDRWQLTCEIVRKMQHDIQLPMQQKSATGCTAGRNVSVAEQLATAWAPIHARGWLDSKTAFSLKNIMQTAQPELFVANMLKEVLKHKYRDDLERAVDLAFAAFHLDIEKCTLALVQQVLPQYLYNSLLADTLVEPQLSILAKLSVYCIYACLEHSNYTPPGTKKRNRVENNDELDQLIPATKIMRMSDGGTTELNVQTVTSSNGSNGDVVLKDPLLAALRDLFNMFENSGFKEGLISQQTHFIFHFLKYLVQIGKSRSSVILPFVPNDLISDLLRSLPGMFTTNLILNFYNINTTQGRNNIAKDLCMLRNYNLKNVK